MSDSLRHVGIVPGNLKNGGPASFRNKLVMGLEQRNIQISHDLRGSLLDSILVINGTRHMIPLIKCKEKGVRIVQRLGIPNYIHRIMPVGWKIYLLCEIRNYLMRYIRNRVADHIVYQSRFAEESWNGKYGHAKVASSMIYNGIDLDVFHPEGTRYHSPADICIISVEGMQGADITETAIHLGQHLIALGFSVELLIFGAPWGRAAETFAQYPFAKYKGLVPNIDLPYYYRGALFYLSTDVISACPNSVIEALACGTPVLAHNTGALPELVDDGAGFCVDFRGDPYRGKEPVNIEGLTKAALRIRDENPRFRKGARHRAERYFNQDIMVDKYLQVLSNNGMKSLSAHSQ